MKFRKKPVVIEAFLFDENHTNTDDRVPRWLVDAVLAGSIHAQPRSLIINTLEGAMRANFGDWIIHGVKGEIYPCKPDIFDVTYEPVRENLTKMEFISREQVLEIVEEYKHQQWAVTMRARIEALFSFPAPNPEWVHGQADRNVMGQSEGQFWDAVDKRTES